MLAYQEFARAPTTESLSALQARLKILSTSTPSEVQIFFEQMALGAELFERYHDFGTFRLSNELHVSSMVTVIGHWRQLYSEDFEVIHDESSNFFRHKELWEKITNNNVPKQMHPVGDGTFVEFPLRVVSTKSIDSKTSHAIQLCDLLAGIAARRFDPRVEDNDVSLIGDMMSAGLREIEFNGVRPGTTFPDQIPPKRLTGPDVVDRMTAIIHGPHND